ncbi:hypothetical protein REXELLA_53 [Erwinia phage vB_EamP_Rexella]|uniref:Uncharacterized protein n=1 Tax=Erwinia phage vB_EamP_Rexella TaxID=1852642 RepID=A0A191ZD13_9CAUD|nr:hypothetical protein REXELLA_53 [Erwinia phage vB_EamP_Rexella]
MSSSTVMGLIDRILNDLFKAEKRRLATAIDQLVEANEEYVQSQMRAFMFNGDIYTHSQNGYRDRPPMLAWALTDRMVAHLRDEKAVNMDKQQIGQMLFSLFGTNPDWQHVLNHLPPCLVPLVPETNAYQRSFGVEDHIQHDERLLRQYRKILPKIEMYSVTGLLY